MYRRYGWRRGYRVGPRPMLWRPRPLIGPRPFIWRGPWLFYGLGGIFLLLMALSVLMLFLR